MSFESKYQAIKDTVKDDLSLLESDIRNLFRHKTPLDEDLITFLNSSAKRLRPVLSFLFSRSISDKINSSQYDVITAVELIHNATLIHDDVIDKAEKRRNNDTLNIKFDDNLAVIAGDFLLSTAMEKIINTESVEVLKMCTQALKSTCIGEIKQYFNKFKITSIEEYIEKSRAKTALLFEIGLLGSLKLCEYNINESITKAAIDFSQNFGIAFQIRDDLINVLKSDYITSQDIDNGIYTAPIIFAYQENNQILSESNILSQIKNTKGIEKTKNLMDNYFDSSIIALSVIEDNMYKKTILELIELFRTSV